MGLDGVRVLEMGMIPSRIESSFLGVNDNFMATLDGVLTDALKLRLCLDGLRTGDWLFLGREEPVFSGIFRIDLVARPNFGVGGGAMLNITLFPGEKKSLACWKFFIGVP